MRLGSSTDNKKTGQETYVTWADFLSPVDWQRLKVEELQDIELQSKDSLISRETKWPVQRLKNELVLTDSQHNSPKLLQLQFKLQFGSADPTIGEN